MAEKWVIDQDGDDIRMRPKYDYDYSRRYKGSIDDGSLVFPGVVIYSKNNKL
jgi:hypothetical protein